MMLYEIWQSVDFADCAMGYRPGAPMRRVWEDEIDTEEGWHVTQILDRIYTQFQRVDEGHMPPEGYTGRSLSMGDVVRLSDNWWACAFVGWDRIEPIQNEVVVV